MVIGSHEVVAEVSRSGVGLITLQRPKALNALNLPMVRTLTHVLNVWADDPTIRAVVVRGTNKQGPFGAFCAGGDIRFFHQAATQGNPELDDFFTEEYALNHRIFTYPKPYLAFMDGVVMGGGMGISQGGRCRIVTAHTRMAMPETAIGLFPDVGGGYFLGRAPGHVGEYLGLTGQTITGPQALLWGLADVWAPADTLPVAWQWLAEESHVSSAEELMGGWTTYTQSLGWQWGAGAARELGAEPLPEWLDQAFGADTVGEIVHRLLRTDSPQSREVLSQLRQRSPLMLHVVLTQIRRARGLSLAQVLRMERDLVRHCFHPVHLGRTAAQSETVEGIRALVIDKDHTPRWNPGDIESVSSEMVAPFFVSPWPERMHPLRDL